MIRSWSISSFSSSFVKIILSDRLALSAGAKRCSGLNPGILDSSHHPSSITLSDEIPNSRNQAFSPDGTN